MNPLFIIAAAAALKFLNNSGAQDRQESLQKAMQTYQRSRAQDNELQAQKFAQTNTPDARAKELADIQAARGTSLQDTVNAARATAVPDIAGKLSPDYQQAKQVSADTVSARIKRAIEQLAVMGAPGEQQVKGGIRYGRAAGNVDANNMAMANVGRGYSTDISNVRPNPFVDMLSQIGMGYGGGQLMGMANRPPPVPKQYPTSLWDNP